MILSDMKYLKIRGKLRDILRGSKEYVTELTEKPKTEEGKREMFRKYFNHIDYKRAKEFYTALRELRQDGIQIPYTGLTRVQNKTRYILAQAETFATETREIRKQELAA